ncbi:MAG: hypothetical protein J5612_05830 [Paludibacteraceae bacterium]|nr:hypothetical protein [Paludibacteraceae bacterium]
MREAQAVVAEADSLWHAGHMYGIDEGDSATLAQAYETLGKYAVFYSFVHRTSSLNTYAHACYHYGRLLREKDDPAAAMQCFINATHTRTSDFQIVGRVYSNMGSICHLAGEYQLAYDMYERSARTFLQDKDTLSYYYLLNDMAYESAERGDSITAISIIKKLENLHEGEFPFFTLLTRAELSLKRKNYSSAIPYAKQALSLNFNNSVTPLLILAQSYSYLGEKDSAVYYANLVLLNTDDTYNINNALYILTNDDESKDIQAVRETAADRSDTQKLIEIKRSKLSQAVQLLEQDLSRKPDLRWLYATIGTLTIISIIIGLYVRRKRKKQTLLSQQIEHLETTFTDLRATRENQIEQMCATLRASTNLQNDLSWKDFDKLCALVNEHFFLLAGKLKQTAVLNETEIRLCILVLIGLSRIEIANTLPYALNSVGKLKDHTAKLLGTTGKNLRIFLLKMAIE